MGEKQDGLYWFKSSGSSLSINKPVFTSVSSSSNTRTSSPSMEIVHARMGHCPKEKLKHMCKIDHKEIKEFFSC